MEVLNFIFTWFNAAKKARGPKAHKLPEQFTKGEVLQDLCKKRWVIGDVIGQGGFGLIYLASKEDDVKWGDAAEYVIKIEPIGNGPLFCELHFYQRVAKPDMIDRWKTDRELEYLGVPKFIASGQHDYKETKYRFMVMQRFGTDLQKLFENNGKQFSKQTVFALALRMLDALEYLHKNSYIHADIKASNCLLGFKSGKPEPDVVYLVDYGLASKYKVDGKHKEYKEDPRKAHDGTIEFTSIDAHKGVAPSRRGDMEILGYCLLQWLCGTLPWEDRLNDQNYVMNAKVRFMDDIPSHMKKCFPKGDIPEEINAYLVDVKKLKYEEKPRYDKCRDLFTKGLNKLGVEDTWKLALPMPGKASKKTTIKPNDRPGSAAKAKPGRPATPNRGKKPTTPKAASRPVTPKSLPSPKPGPSSPVPGVSVVKGKAATSKQTVKGKTTKPSTPVGKSIIPGQGIQSPSSIKIPGRTKTVGTKVRAMQAKSPVTSPQVTNGQRKRDLSPAVTSPAPKKRKVVRKRNAHLVETACQTSPGLKMNK